MDADRAHETGMKPYPDVPAGLVVEPTAVLRITQLDTMGDALTSAIGMPTGVQLPTRMAERAAARRKAVLTLMGSCLAVLLVMSFAFGAANDRWDLSTLAFGVMLAGCAVGAILGTVVARRHLSRNRAPSNRASRKMIVNLVALIIGFAAFTIVGNWTKGNTAGSLALAAVLIGLPIGCFAGWALTRASQSRDAHPGEPSDVGPPPADATEPRRLRR
jgi:hypothetical protein